MARRIVGLSDLKKKEEDDSDDEKQNKLFAGGLDQRGGGSGLNVINPPTGGRGAGPPDNSLFGQIQRNATRAGALAESSAPGTGPRISIYRNGFTVDDGPLRDPHAPENAEFIQDIMNGRVPRELVGRGVDIDLVDKHGEDYVAPPPPAYVAFSGGHSLTEGVTTEIGLDSFVLDFDVRSTLPATPDPIDESTPVTTVQVRTHTGQKLKIRINQHASILQLAIAINSQFTTNDTYVLTAGFPPAELKDPEQTILEANLLNAVVTLKKI